MFKLDDYGLAAKNARVLERIYHKGQDFAWDGREVLASLIEGHGPPTLPEDTKRALGRIFSVIMWGELAAWQHGGLPPLAVGEFLGALPGSLQGLGQLRLQA